MPTKIRVGRPWICDEQHSRRHGKGDYQPRTPAPPIRTPPRQGMGALEAPTAPLLPAGQADAAALRGRMSCQQAPRGAPTRRTCSWVLMSGFWSVSILRMRTASPIFSATCSTQRRGGGAQQ